MIPAPAPPTPSTRWQWRLDFWVANHKPRKLLRDRRWRKWWQRREEELYLIYWQRMKADWDSDRGQRGGQSSG